MSEKGTVTVLCDVPVLGTVKGSTTLGELTGHVGAPVGAAAGNK